MDAVKPAGQTSHRSSDIRQPSRRTHFFSAKSHTPIWRALRAALQRAEGVILVVGGEGIGKTSLIKRLHGMLPDNRDLVLIPSPDLPDTEFLQQLITATTLVKRGDAGSLSPVETHSHESQSTHPTPTQPTMTAQDLFDAMEERVAMGRKLVLAIDQAHLLNGAQLTMLDMMVRFVTEGIKPVQILLAGRPELRALMASAESVNLEDQVVGSCEMTPLTRREVWEYLLFQLERSPGGPIKVSWLAWWEIFRYSQGIPQKIDQLLKRMLPLIKQRNAKVVTRSMARSAMTRKPMRPIPVRLLGLAGGALLLTGMGYLLTGWFHSPTPGETDGSTGVKKGTSGENSSYIQLFKQDDPSNPTLASKSIKSTDDKTENKPTITKKRYWEPSQTIRPDTTQPVTAQPVANLADTNQKADKPGQHSMSNPAPAQATPRSIPDPETFRKRYQSAKALQAASISTQTPEPMEKPSRPAPKQEADGVNKTEPTPNTTRFVPLPSPPARSNEADTTSKESVPPSPPQETEGAKKLQQSAKTARSTPSSLARADAANPNDLTPDDDEEDMEVPNEPTPRPPPTLPDTSGIKKQRADAKTAKSAQAEAMAPRPVATDEESPKPVSKPTKPKAVPSPAAESTANAAKPPSGVATEKSFRASGKLFVVQIGSYSNLDNAEQLKKALMGKGGDPYVHLFEKNKRRWFSVRMNYRGRSAADRMAQTIHSQQGLPTKVLELNYE
ncbi:MAG: AAA family ATPase [Magnetococcus sp. YQC-5]